MTAQHFIYEIIGEGIAVAAAHKAALDAHRAMCWDFVEANGATGYRPSKDGRINNLLFDDSAPDGWRSLRRIDGKVECIPKKNTKAGKTVDAEFSAIPPSPSFSDISEHFNWSGGDLVIGGTDNGRSFKILRPQFLFVTRPKLRYFLALPRKSNDGFVVPNNLVELRQSEYMAAIEVHESAERRAAMKK